MRRTIIALLAVACAVAHAGPKEARREKAAYLWRSVNPRSFNRPLSDFLCAEFERADMGDQWWFAFVNYVYASSLKPSMVCRGGGMVARGIADCTERHLSRDTCLRRFGTTSLNDPYCGMANDVEQARQLRCQTGREGWALRRSVFLPARPHSARAYQEERRWRGVAKRMEKRLAAGYATGAIGRNQQPADAGEEE